MTTTQLSLRDVTLRDGQQSLFATRMTQAQVDRVLPFYRSAGFPYLEVWGGAVPDSVMRFLGENPWHRLEKVKAAVGSSAKLTALSRGRNLFGYAPYPDAVIEGFARHAVSAGVDVMRVFDALNDLDNVASSIRGIRAAGGEADGAVCYTVDPVVSTIDRLRALVRGNFMPRRIFGLAYFVERAKALEAQGASMVTVKDMAGLLDPASCAALIPRLKAELAVPVCLHTHCTPGYGLATVVTALLHGVDIVDTAILPFSGGPAAPSYELVQLFADRLGLETGIDRAAVGRIGAELRIIRGELAAFDEIRSLPRPLDLSRDHLPPSDERLVDAALEAARAGRWTDLLTATRALEASMGLPAPDDTVRTAQIPGGMYTNMLAQLKGLSLEHLVPQVLALVPRVRWDAGCPPLVTPTSQIVGAQAVNCVVDVARGQPMYTTVSNQFRDLVRGIYGRTPVPVDPSFRERIAGVRAETPYDIGLWRPQDVPLLPDCGHVSLTRSERERLLLELFPAVAKDFLHGVRRREAAARAAARPPLPTAPDDEGWADLHLRMQS